MKLRYEPRGKRRNAYREHVLSVPFYLVVSLLTCFLFDLYWNYRQMEACNDLLGRDQFNFGLWLFLCFITLGLYHFYYQYQMGCAIVEIQRHHRVEVMAGLPVVSVVATLLGLGVVADCIHQREINRIAE